MTASRFVKETAYIEKYLNKNYLSKKDKITWLRERISYKYYYNNKSFWLNCWLLVNDVPYKEINKMSMAQKLTYIHLFGEDT